MALNIDKINYTQFNKEYWYINIHNPNNFDVNPIFFKLILDEYSNEKFIKAKVICKLKKGKMDIVRDFNLYLAEWEYYVKFPDGWRYMDKDRIRILCKLKLKKCII